MTFLLLVPLCLARQFSAVVVDRVTGLVADLTDEKDDAVMELRLSSALSEISHLFCSFILIWTFASKCCGFPCFGVDVSSHHVALAGVHVAQGRVGMPVCLEPMTNSHVPYISSRLCGMRPPSIRLIWPSQHRCRWLRYLFGVVHLGKDILAM